MSNSQTLALGFSFSFGSSLGTSFPFSDSAFNTSSSLISSPSFSLTSFVGGLGLSPSLHYMSIYCLSSLSENQMSRTLMISSTDCPLWFGLFSSELAELGVTSMKEFKTCSYVSLVSIIRTGALGGGTFW